MMSGRSIVGGEPHPESAGTFTGFDPAAGASLEPTFHYATPAALDRAAGLAEEAFVSFRNVSGRDKARFLRHIAAEIDAIGAELVSRAQRETALPEARLKGELARTVNQLKVFAQVVEEGSWVNARIDPAKPERKPLPRADIRSMLRALGPVAVFGASNFPLAFSVAGGDTASALAAGCPVIVKAHSAHPGTSELVGRAIARSARELDLPEGVFALLYGTGPELGAALVRHPTIKGVGFTGSLHAGKALADMCAARPEPIPCFAEMSSVNPVFVLPQALHGQVSQIANGLFASFTLSVGQLCTKPGLVFLPANEQGDALVAELKKLVKQAGSSPMLTEGIANSYNHGVVQMGKHSAVRTLALAAPPAETPAESSSWTGAPALLEICGRDLLAHPELAGEVFGPSTLLIRYEGRAEMLKLARALEGQLTATLHGTDGDILEYFDLVGILERRAGRLIVNGYPTGVEVCDAMVHGGPFPATSDSRFTSVGSLAIYRWARPVCYQNFPDVTLPEELRNENPLGILRTINGVFTREPLGHEHDVLHGQHVFTKI